MVRETRHLWVGNLPENIREDRIREHFKRYGRVQSVKLLPPSSVGSGGGTEESSGGGGGLCATVAFMDIKSASKAHTAEHKLDERSLTTEYYEPPTASMLHMHDAPAAGSPGTTTGGTTVGGAGAYPPRSPRFPPHGPAEETFERSSHFYRGGSGPAVGAGPETEATTGYLPRRGPPGPPGTGPAYHATSAGRARERQGPYRNGPSYPPPHLETSGRGSNATSHHRAGSGGSGTWPPYDGTGPRYPAGGDPEEPPIAGVRQPTPCTPSSPASSTATSPSQAAPPAATASLLTLSSASASAARKSRHAKRRRGGTTRSSAGDSEHSSGRGSRSSSRSSCSSSNSAGSSSSTGSSRSSSPGGSPRGQHASSRLLANMPPPSGGSHHNSSIHGDDRRPLAICVRNLPVRSSDTSLKEGLFHEYKKHGKVTWVKVVGSGIDRYALVYFKKPEDVEKALEVSHDKLFFGCKIDVAPYEGFDVEDNDFRPYEAELDEFHPKATRTLFIGNLEKDVTAAELRKHFEQFGEIVEIDIKKQGLTSSYAFCQYADISAVVSAMRSMDGEHLGNNRIKLGFGKSMPTNCVWVDGVAESVSEKYLSMHFHKYGSLTQVLIDRSRGHALVFYEQLTSAQAAVKEFRGVALRGRRLQLDFASRECQEAFYAHLEKQEPGTWERPPAAPFEPRETGTPRFENVTPTGTPNNARFTRYEPGSRPARGGNVAPHAVNRGGGGAAAAPTTRPNRSGRQPPHPRFDYYDEFSARFRTSGGEEYVPGHEDGGSYEQELRDYGYCQRERRTDYPAGVDPEHSPSPAQVVGAGDDVVPEEATPAPLPARRHSRQLSTTSDHESSPPVRITSPPPNKRLSGYSNRLLSCSPRTPYYDDKEGDAKCKDASPVSTPGSIISSNKSDLSNSGGVRGPPHRHGDGKEPPPIRRLHEGEPLPPPSAPVTEGDMKHLQKERVHIKQLLDQLGETQANSGDESAMAKRLKIAAELKEASDGKIECFRKIEPRRLSDLKGRRISTESYSGKDNIDKYHLRGDYAPHFIPKRRKTESSSEGGEGLHRDSSDGSRPGTPLCDERPSEPRKPRDRPFEGPISLPLPRFALQMLTPRPGLGGPGKVVYTIKSPPPPLSNRHLTEPPPRTSSTEEKQRDCTIDGVINEVPLSPSRPDSSSESERSPRASPTLEERIRKLDEKYTKWWGSRTMLASEAHKLDSEKLKARTKVLDLNELRSQPSEIVKSVLAKRSVFDEDTKRLENYNEKYEPKDFASSSWRAIAATSSTISSSLLLSTSIQSLKTETKPNESWMPNLSTPLPTSSPLPAITSPKSILITSRSNPAPKSPFSTGTPTIPVLPPKNNPAPQMKPVLTPKTSVVPSPATSPRPSAKGLQYPFPTHPPVSSPVSLIPGSPRCQPPLSSPVQCSPAALDSAADWPPTQQSCLPTPPPSACGSPCVLPTTAPPPPPPEENKPPPPIANKTVIKKENNVITPTISNIKHSSNISSSALQTTTLPLTPVRKEASPPISTTPPPAIITTITSKVEPPQEKQQEVVNCLPPSRKESISSTSSTSSTVSNSSSSALYSSSVKKESHNKPHKSHSQEKINNERRESVEEKPRAKERRDSGKEHRPASIGNKRRISSQDEPRHTPASAVETPTVTEQLDVKKAKLSSPTEKAPPAAPQVSTPKSLVKPTPDRRDSKDSSRQSSSSTTSSSSSNSGSKKSEERRKHDKERKPEEKQPKVCGDEKPSSHSSKSHSSEKKPTLDGGERHRSKERKRSKSERERSRITDDKQTKPRDEFRNKHESTEDKNKSSKIRDKKSDRSSSRRSESDRRKERSTPKKASTPAATPSQPSTPQPAQQQSQQQLQQQLQHHLQQHQQSHQIPRDSGASDSDLSEDGQSKKHSIFDIVDDEPAYISMYDKVKARSTKNMQKQEEEKQKERLKEKFNQLKQSRAKREEKKRSTSWDEDSDSDTGHKDRNSKPSKRPGKLVITSSSEDDGEQRSRRRLCSDISHTDKSESEAEFAARVKRKTKLLKSDQDATDEDDEGSTRTKSMLSRRNFKPKITSDTSDYDDVQKYKPTLDNYSDSDLDKNVIPTSTPIINKSKTKENSRETFESSDEGKFDKKHYDGKFKLDLSENEIPNCVDKQRKSHKSKRRLSGKNNCIDQSVETYQSKPMEELEVRLERIDERLKLDHKKAYVEEKSVILNEHKRAPVEPAATNDYKRSSTDSEHKRHSSSRRERRRSGHHEDKDDTESKASSRSRKKKSKKDAIVKQEVSNKQRDEKMENIFGPLSDDSETGIISQNLQPEPPTKPTIINNNNQTFNSRKWHFNSVYSSDSDSNVDNSLIHRTSPSLPIPQPVKVEVLDVAVTEAAAVTTTRRSEEKRRKRERRRSRERRERRMQRESKSDRADDELLEAGRVLESHLQGDRSPHPPPQIPSTPSSTPQQTFDVFRFTDDESVSAESSERPKEKKKKHKRSKEERSRKEHHDKSSREPETEKKRNNEHETCRLPNLLPSPTSPAKAFSPEPKSFPKHFEDVDERLSIEPVQSKPAVDKKRSDIKLIPGFGTEVDATIHETAVQSISFTPKPEPDIEPETVPTSLLCSEPEEKDDKPRTVISQEETEDAVAALLEEKFDFTRYSDEGEEEPAPHELREEPVITAVQDEEQLASEEAQKETQQAVQSLECELPISTSATVVVTPPQDNVAPEEESKEAERADTPQSEHDLQIDESAQACSDDETPSSPARGLELDDEETVPCASPNAADIMDFSRPPKTPDFPAAYYQHQQQQLDAAEAREKQQTEIKQEPEDSNPETCKTPESVSKQPERLIEESEEIVVKSELETNEVKSVEPEPPCAPLIPEPPRHPERTVPEPKGPTPTIVPSKAAAVTAKPAVVASTPAVLTPKPAVATSKTTVLLHKPAVVSTTQTVVIPKLTTAATKPAVALPKPVIATTTPAVVVTPKPAVVTSKPAVVTSKPAVVTAIPAVVMAKPAVATTMPAVVTATPTIATGTPAVLIATPAVATSVSAVVATKPAVVTTKPAVVTTKTTVVTLKPTVIAIQPSVITAKPIVVSQKAAAVQEPAEPKPKTPEPVVKTPEPVVPEEAAKEVEIKVEAKSPEPYVEEALQETNPESVEAEKVVVKEEPMPVSPKPVEVTKVLPEPEVHKENLIPEPPPPTAPEVHQSPLLVRKVELSAPLIRDLAAQALQEAAAATHQTPAPREEHTEFLKSTVNELEERIEPVNARCNTRRGGRSRRGTKAVSRGGVSTRRTARGGGCGRISRSVTGIDDHSHTEESAEEKLSESASPEHAQRGRKSRRGRKKKTIEPETGEDKLRIKSTLPETNDIYEFHDTDDEDLHYESKVADKSQVATAAASPQAPTKPGEVHSPPVAVAAPEETAAEGPHQRRDSITEDASGRPRLILTIKSPLKEGSAKVETREEFEQAAHEPTPITETPCSKAPPAIQPSVQTQAVASQQQQQHQQQPTVTTGSLATAIMNVKSPPGPTRKSRRLQEKDNSRSTIDDIIEEVIKGNFVEEVDAPVSPATENRMTTRRSGRATRQQRASDEPMTSSSPQVAPRVAPRAAPSSVTSRVEEEKHQQPTTMPTPSKIDIPKPAASQAPVSQQQTIAAPSPPVQVIQAQKTPQVASSTVFKPGVVRADEPTTLIDPVTGLLIPMRESEEGQYIPVTTSVSVIQAPSTFVAANAESSTVRPPQIKASEVVAVSKAEVHRGPPTSVARVPPVVMTPPRPATQAGATVVKLITSVPAPPASSQPPIITVAKVQQPPPPPQQAPPPPPPVSRPPVATPTSYTMPVRSSSAEQLGPGAPFPPPWSNQTSTAPHAQSRLSPLPAAVRQQQQQQPPHIPIAHASSLPSKHLVETVPQSPQGARPCLPQPAHTSSTPDRQRDHRRTKEDEIPLSMLPPRLRVGAAVRNSASAIPVPVCNSTPAAEPPQAGGCIVASGAPAQPRPPRVGSRESPISGGRPTMGHTATHSQVLQAGLPVPAYEAASLQQHSSSVAAAAKTSDLPHLLPPPLPPPTHGLSGAQVIERVPNRGQQAVVPSRSPPPAHQQGEVVRVPPNQHAPGFAPVAHLQQRQHEVAAHQLMQHPDYPQIMYQHYLRAQHDPHGPPTNQPAYHHQSYHLPQGPPGASRSPAIPGFEVKADVPEASDEALALGPRVPRAPTTSPPLELRRTPISAPGVPRLAVAHMQSPHDRTTDSPQVATVYGARYVQHPHQVYRGAEHENLHGAPLQPPQRVANYMAPPHQILYEEEGLYRHAAPPPAHHQRRGEHPTPGQEAPPSHQVATLQQSPRLQVETPPHVSQVPPQEDSLMMLLQRYPVMWQGLLSLKNDQAAVHMHFVHGNPDLARDSLPCNSDGTTPPLRVSQRMRLEQTQLEGVARKMKLDLEHCMLLALSCGRDHKDVIKQNSNLQEGFITYLQQKQAAGIVNIAAPGSQQTAYVVHIFPSCEFTNGHLSRIAPDLFHRVQELSHLLIIIASV